MSATAITRPGERTRVSTMLPAVSWNLVALLTMVSGIGIAMLFSAAGGSWKPWALSTAVRYVACVFIMLALALVGLRRWFVIAYPVYAIGFVLLLAVMVVGHSALGAQRWLHVGPIGVQPSEVMKIGLVLALARFYQGLSARDAVWSWKLVIPAVLILAPAALVAKQPDLGTALLIVFTGVAMMFVAGLTWKVLAAGAAFAV
ncbi:MAG: FtsW/RodA/SpoVE family cell cycle protein, partial [Caulobacteraceae bacterium]|nr:FtsW/RodA/SpoVE family cell cycle protein [Caulobacter sp.]